jgi:sugar lactone lactonase YvrE
MKKKLLVVSMAVAFGLIACGGGAGDDAKNGQSACHSTTPSDCSTVATLAGPARTAAAMNEPFTYSLGFTDGIGASARFNFPYGVAVDSAGNAYVADTMNHAIRKITPAGVVTTLAGNGTRGFADGVGRDASFAEPKGVAVDSAGNVYVADTLNSAIRKITPAGVVTTLAGNGDGWVDGAGSDAKFSLPTGIAVDSAGTLYVADSLNHAIRKITPAGVVTTLAGGATYKVFGNGHGAIDGTGSDAGFFGPRGVAVDGSGNVYVADSDNHAIRKITPAGVVTTLAGDVTKGYGIKGYVDQTGVLASFYFPNGVAVDAAGNVYVADSLNNVIRAISPLGVVTTLAGNDSDYSSNGIGTLAGFNHPYGIASSATGKLYVADKDNHGIRTITH